MMCVGFNQICKHELQKARNGTKNREGIQNLLPDSQRYREDIRDLMKNEDLTLCHLRETHRI